jgi:hypothetical protein
MRRGRPEHGLSGEVVVRADKSDHVAAAPPWTGAQQPHDHRWVPGVGLSGSADARARSAAHAAPALGSTLVLVEAAPRAVLLRPRKGVVKAFDADGALGADGLGLALAHVALGLTLAVGPEEKHKVLSPARGVILPSPTGAGAGDLPTYLRHETTTLG